MTEGERVRLYNDLCDFMDDLKSITYPPQTKQIDILSRAVMFVRGSTAVWQRGTDSTQVPSQTKAFAYYPCTWSFCHFASGRTDYKFCPSCGTRMK